PASLALGGKRRAITLFFADIRGFTSMSETMADKPEMVLDVVNRFHSAMTDIVIAKGGTIDKYIGDALMSLFGAPMALSAADDAFNAIDAAVAIRTECLKIREQLIKEGKTAVNVGIGINTGEVVVGMVGSKQMMNYTAIGDSVNTAARIEANAGAGQVLISKATYELVKTRIKVKMLEPIMVKGKKEPVEILEVLEVIK
ncbi:MAG TPA: adenylate/guanylate cyclase domain-containing protein, partial [Candidatus Wallbacteria bacterium]|nr:adenylate/guanylate cyclase domain-containing protein [Candidatus Wallbacteria bacterium]